MNNKPHFSILATSFAGGPRPRNAALILSSLWLLLFFAALFSPPLLDDADATHALAAHSMAASGDLVTLHVNGIRYLEKAPLPYWLTAASFRIFGENTFAAHLPQALAVLLLMLLGHRWGNKAFGSRTGFYTALGILTSTGVFLFTRILIPEALLSLLLAIALYAFLRTVDPVPETIPTEAGVPHVSPLRHGMHHAGVKPSVVHPNLNPTPERPALTFALPPATYPYIMWTALALAVLTKGLVALVFFFATTLLYLALTADFPKWRLLKPFTGMLLFLAIAAPWHVLAGLRNTGGMDGHGFFWFYFWNEHVLRFLGRRLPRDYNKLPGYLFWLQHLVWLFPWSLFLPLGFAAMIRRERHQNKVLTAHLIENRWRIFGSFILFSALAGILYGGRDAFGYAVVLGLGVTLSQIALRRRRTGLTASPFHRIDSQQRTILLLSVFATIVLLFFSLSTNQEYYTFPAYLPILLLIAAIITRAEQTYSSSPSSQRWITFAHAAFTAIGTAAALALLYGLWTSRRLPFVPDIGDLLAHRGVGSYTLSTSHLFDLTGPSFAALRLPATLALLAFAFGPAFAWMLRMQRRHLAATSAIAFTAASFLFAAHIAFARFGPMLSSEDLAAKIQELEDDRRISRDNQVLLFGDQAYGSSIPFYLGEQVNLVDGRSTSMLFGSTFPDAPRIFLTQADLLREWGQGDRKILFIPAELREQLDALLPASRQVLIEETSGKALITDRPLDTVLPPSAR